MNSDGEINIAIIDDHNLFRKGLIKLINLGDPTGKYFVLFEAEDGNDLKEKLDSNCLPQIVLMDINMPNMDGYSTVEWLQKNYPDISVLVISMLESEEAVIKMLRLGVKGYLSKDIEVEDMHQALEAIANKGFYYPDFVSGIMADALRTPSILTTNETQPKEAKALSENELQFIKLASTELTYHQIADKMNLSPKTIDGYREALFRKLKIKSRVGLAMFAVKNGLVKP